MNRYNKQLNFPENETNKLKDICNKFNLISYKRSEHGFNRLKQRFDLKDILYFINKISYKYSEIFEYYTLNGEIKKVCYRLSYNEYKDIIIVLDNRKVIVTVYLNNKKDNHSSLNKELYTVN